MSSSSGTGSGTAANPTNAITTPIVAAMNMNPAMGNLATLMANQASMDMSNSTAAAASLANAFGVAAGIGPMGGLNPSANQFATANNPGGIAAALQNTGVGMGGLQSGQTGGNNPLGMLGGAGGGPMGGAGLGGTNIGSSGGAQAQPSPFQT